MTPKAASLVQRIASHSAEAWKWIGTTALMVALAFGGVTVSAEIRARTFRAATARLSSPQVYATRHDAAAIARLFDRASLTATFARVAAHLPPTVELAQAGVDAAGVLRLVVDSSDPDALRVAFRKNSWLAQFRQRSEDQIDDGRFRLTFEARL